MTRRSRIDAVGALHHIMIRGIERGEIFGDDVDRNHFIVNFLEKVKGEACNGSCTLEVSGIVSPF
ncbi:MAG: Transposase [Thermodesulfobacteriota bacterium]|nr:Transposase [Thermodesulfobacteriota bacterium]